MKLLPKKYNMRVHFYIHVNELEYLHKALKGELNAEKYQISIAPNHFENSYLIDISYDDFTKLNDNNTLISLISL
jgi:hypothetical protein